METITQAKIYIADNARKGTRCPCCYSFIKLYKRKFNSGMARFLIGLYKQGGTATASKIIIAEKLGNAGSDYCLLEFFGLMKTQPNIDPKKKKSGSWVLTNKGISFVEGSGQVRSHCIVFMGKLQGFSGVNVGIHKVLGKHFDYSELMDC